MPEVSVSLTPDFLIKDHLRGRIVVVVDILRATSCMVTGLAEGVAEIKPLKEVHECFAMREDGYFIAGERGGIKLDGFDIGNSPFEYMQEDLKGKKVAITTTNGTYAIHKSLGAEKIIIGAFLNLSSVTKYLKNQKKDVLIVCAGWRNNINLEDTLFAGALIDRLQNDYKVVGDSAILAFLSFRNIKDNLLQTIQSSEHALRLGKVSENDLKLCATIDKYDVVPIYTNGSLILT